MKLIDKDFKAIKLRKGQSINDLHYWEYRMYPEKQKEQRGFYLTFSPTWNIITSNAYILQVGKEKIQVPASHYVMIGDLDGGLDFIKLDEVLGRPFEAFTLSSDFESDSWMLKDIKVCGYRKDCRIPYPDTKGIVPVLCGNRALLVSTVDMYNKLGGYSFSDFN